MKVTAECIPCYLNQCLNAMDKGNWPEEKREELLVALLPYVAGLNRECTPAENSTVILHKLVEMMGGSDPFAYAKKESNRRAIQYLERLQKMVHLAEDPLKQAVKFSVAGNVVDLGLFHDYNLGTAIKEVNQTKFKRDDYDLFKKKLNGAKKVLIIGDNSGEIVFDRLLADVLNKKGIDVVYSVKNSFILNDATMEDARQAGLDTITRIITNGNNYLGTIEEKCSREFLAELRESDLVISKGQANYESLEGTSLAGEKTFFLLKAKCPVVAESLGVDYGDLVFVQNKVAAPKV